MDTERKTKKAVSEQEALLKLSALCARSEHSSGEMLDKMRRWQMPEEAQARVVERLVADKYVDDARFAQFFVRDKMRFDKWGRRKIEQALYRKGVARETIREALDSVPDGEYVEILRPMLAAKRRSTKASSQYEMDNKLIKFALGRGFDFNVIRQCIDNADEHDIPFD